VSGDEQILEQIYDALDGGDPQSAEALARQALERQHEDDPVLRLLHGVALLDLDRPAEAAESLKRAIDLDPDDAEARSNLAVALFRSGRFAEATLEAERARADDCDLPDAHAILGLLAERRGSFEESDRFLNRAAELDPERFPPPVRLSRAEFEAEVRRAGARLPEDFRRHLDAVVLTVEDVPADELIFEGDPPLDPELLGLFVGVPLTERSHLALFGELPPRILLFQRNLERNAVDHDDLRDEIAVTVYHELGHFLGFDEAELAGLDLA